VATQTYPLSLGTILRASKSRSQSAAFRMTEPRRGMPYAQAIGTTAPQQWDVQFRFTWEDAVRFQLWFTQNLENGANDFTMALRTEAGLVTHLLQFLPDGLSDCRQEGEAFVYDARMVGSPV